MSRTIKMMCLGVMLAIGFTSCEKEISYESGDLGGGTGAGGGSQSGTAVFTLSGAPGGCTAPVISGTYMATTALTTSNTVSLSVDVTTVGTYTISTGTANGISFVATGSFTSLGSHIIMLYGSGTPAIATTSLFTPGINGCSFSITTTPFVAGPVAVGTIDCGGSTVTGVYTQGIDLTSTNTVAIPVTVTTAGTYSITTTVSGATFSGSGNLATGAQTITLTGSGTPVAAGEVSFPIALGASTCSFPITFLPGTIPTDFLKCSIDGGAVTSFSTNLSGLMEDGSFSVAGDNGTQNLTVSITYSNGGTITVGTYHNVSTSNLDKYCTDTYRNSGVIWGDISGVANDFTVNIATITATTVTGTFNGKLLNPLDGTSKNITNGSFSITY